MKLWRMPDGIFVECNDQFFKVEGSSWDELIAGSELVERLKSACSGEALAHVAAEALAPCVGQDVWAAGVTYHRSRSARIEESQGGGSFYDKVYEAERPELFFKAAGRRVVGPGGTVRIRRDAAWNVPEPEWTLVINASGSIVGYTIGNDMSSRDIEGENPLYLPQAKVYDGSCAIGPCILVAEQEFNRLSSIEIAISRGGKIVFAGETTLTEMKRAAEELVSYLFRENSFPEGALLMTGTGIVPEDSFTLARGDSIKIRIEGIGILENVVG